MAVGAAWGYAWGNCNWGRGDVNVNVNQNRNVNNSIDRSKHQNKVTGGEGGRGSWKHDPEHRKGAAYRDQSTAQKYDRAGSRDAQSRDGYRGRGETGRQDAGGATQAGRTLAGVTAQQAAVRMLGVAATPVRLAAAGLNRGVTKALSEARNEEVRRGTRAAAAVKACHLPAVAAGAVEAA